MMSYRELTKDLVVEEVKERLSYDKELTESEVLNDILENTGNVFGNIDGSRTYSTYKAETYFAKTLARGAEVLDVAMLELLAPQVISEMLEELNRG